MKLSASLLSALLAASTIFAEEPTTAAKVDVTAPEAPAPTRGTLTYNADEVNKLFIEEQRKQAEREANIAAFKEAEEDMELVELKPFQVEADRLRNDKELYDKLDPKPRLRLQRIQDLDSSAANEIQVTLRSQQEFFSGSYDRTIDPNGGATANFSASQLLAGAANFGEAIRGIFGGKPREERLDDEIPIPTTEDVQ